MIDKPSRSKRVLIVDDEPIIAMDLESSLVDAGYEIAGVTGRIATALLLVESEIIDVAILDANLGGEDSTPVAVALSARGVPFLVCSGYDAHQLPPALRGAPFLRKLANSNEIIETVNGMLAARTI